MIRVRWYLTAFAAALLVAMLPSDASAQCMACRPCDFGPGLMCVGVQEGTPGSEENCGQQMSGGHCGCRTYGGPECEWPFADAATMAASEQAAVAAVEAGRMLKSDGPYYFVRNGGTAALRRKCDHSLVARVALTNQLAVRTRNVVGG